MKYTGLNKYIKLDSLEIIKEKIKDGTIKEVIDDWKWIFSYSFKYKGIVIFYTILGIFSSTLSLGSSYVSAMLINIITGKQREKLWLLVCVMLGSTAFSLIFNSIMSRISIKISIRVNNDIQGEIFDKIIDAKWEELNKYKYGDILHRFNTDVSTISGNAISWIPNFIISIYTFVITFIVLVKMDYIMAIIATVSAPILLAMSKIIMRKMKEYKERLAKMNSDMMSFEVDTFYNFNVIKSFGIIKYYSNELRNWQKKYKEHNLEYNAFEIKTNIALSILGTTVSMGAFGYCLFRLWAGQILYGDMTFFLQQRSSLTSRFNTLVKTFPSMLNTSVSAHRIRELVELPKEEHNENVLKQIEEVKDKGLTIIVDDVTYSYDKKRNVYENANFIAKPNEIVAVLGESGGGKTTLFRLLLGLVNPDEGNVFVEDFNGKRLNINADLRQVISYVPQGNTVVLGTIADNLRMIKEDASDEELINALKIAQAWEFVEPLGLNGKVGEKGKGLSEGQSQRIAIARAMLRNAPILFLDEATSALDEKTENAVLDSIVKNCPNKTIIISTHRPSVLSRCDKIYRITNMELKEDAK